VNITPLVAAIAVSELIACWIAWRVMRSSDPLWLRVCNALIAFIPFIGPVAAYWAANFPNPHHPAMRDNERYSSDVYQRWIGVIGMTDQEKKKARWKAVMKQHEGKESER
jgi:hypothetical protein